MDWTYYLWALLLVVGSFVAWLLSLVTLPGNWLIVGVAALFAWLLPADESRRHVDDGRRVVGARRSSAK